LFLSKKGTQRHEGSKIYVEKCPLMTSSYTPEHLFKFKKNDYDNIDKVAENDEK
jgi:hypothetical protein